MYTSILSENLAWGKRNVNLCFALLSADQGICMMLNVNLNKSIDLEGLFNARSITELKKAELLLQVP